MKTCSKCDQTYDDPSASFYPNKRALDGFASWCRPCSNKATIASRKKLAERGREDGKKPAWFNCTGCALRLRFTTKYFPRGKHQPHGLNKRCRTCTNKTRVEYNAAHPLTPEQASAKWARDKRRITRRVNQDPIRERARRMRRGIVERTKRHGWSLDPRMTRDYLEQILREIAVCPCCSTTLDPSFTMDKGRQNNSPSIDRFDPSLGYTVENVEVLCWRCNELKRDASPTELRLLAEWAEARLNK